MDDFTYYTLMPFVAILFLLLITATVPIAFSYIILYIKKYTILKNKK
ncbi:hypothetical protein [Caudoviricetes sp.]|nr:hypothetical protein [Caudoviricetes sp.]